jgi:vacuolar-type H+-ATPase subunit E/Vma4
MNVEPVRRVLLDQARSQARSLLDAARREAATRRSEAEARSRALVERAAAEQVAAAQAERIRRLAQAERKAYARLLRARRDAYDELRKQGHAAAGDLRSGPEYAALRERLEAAARAQLGEGATVREPRAGGVVGAAGGRLVDYSLPAMVERCLAELGAHVEALWR